MPHDKIPTYLNLGQRRALSQILPDLSDRDIARYYTFTQLEQMRIEGIIAPNLVHVERLVWMVLKLAERRLFRTLTEQLSLEHRTRLDGLLYAETKLGGATRLSWLRRTPSVASPKSVKQIVERLLFLRGLELPALPASLHQNRVLQLARKASRYQAQPLLNFKQERRQALLHISKLSYLE